MNAPSARPRLSSNVLPAPDAPSQPDPPSSGRPFPKSSRILKNADFRRVYDGGVRFTTRLFAAFCLDTSDGSRPSARVGFTVPRALGKAVRRNRIRRRMREALRQELPFIGPQWDVVVNPRRAVLDAPFADVRNEVRKLVSRCRP